MKNNRLLLLLFGFFLYCTSIFSQPPLPPIGSHPVWRVGWVTQLEEGVDEFTYGDQYVRCNHLYVAVLRNGIEEIMYIRMTNDRVFYLLDINDCNNERLLYDYSFSETIFVPIRTEVPLIDSFQNVLVVLEEEHLGLTLLGDNAREISYHYQSGLQFTLHSYWFRGVGDILEHPFYSIINNFDPLQEINYQLQSLEVNQQLWYCAGNIDCISNDIIYVDKDVTEGLHNGQDWENAFASLEHALVVADSGNVLWVAEGEYKINELSGRGASFVLRDGISIFGGFQGDETLFIQRLPDENTTILSGDIGVLGDSTDNSYHVLQIQNVESFAVIDGVQIIDGNAIGGEAQFPFSRNGGGVLVFSGLTSVDTARIYFNNCQFEKNTAFFGGALTFHNNYSIPTILDIRNSKVDSNISTFFGGGFYIPDFSPINMQVNLFETSFSNNTSYMGGGGAIYDFHDATEWTMTNCLFTQNSAIHGAGGAFRGDYSTVNKKIEILNSEFLANASYEEGGAIDIIHTGSNSEINFFLEETSFVENESRFSKGASIAIGSFAPLELQFSAKYCDFISNKSLTSGANIAIYSGSAGHNGKIDIDYCTFKSNGSVSSLGGALHVRIETPLDNIVTNRLYEIKIKNSLFVDNKGVISHSALTQESGIVDSIINCSFINNRSVVLSKGYTSEFDGLVFKNDMYLRNCIIWEPDLPFDQILYNGDPDTLDIYDYELDHCLIRSDVCSLPGGDEACQANLNFFDVNPVFKNPENGDYTLSTCSPLLNMGVNYSGIGELDLANNPRLLEEAIDLGAYETQSSEIQISTILTDASTSNSNDGSIELINIEGGVSPYVMEWSNGDSSVFNNMLTAGEYQLLLTDAQGCMLDSVFLVSFINANNDIITGDVHWELTNNPSSSGTSSEVILEGLKPGLYTLEIYNSFGQILYSYPFEFNQSQKRIMLKPSDTSVKGSYYLILKNKIGQFLGSKIWVQL